MRHWTNYSGLVTGEGPYPEPCFALTTGEQFPDALCGAALCGKNSSVILLASDIPGGYAALDGNLTGAEPSVELGYILGGTGAVSDSTAAYAESKLNEGH
ncbi:MAG: cell wall-binding repeat-containing protein [Coriobacteriales bacterium]|nr:cell wall-binding repeat-containing protein [Coriobacteriales bacterium]